MTGPCSSKEATDRFGSSVGQIFDNLVVKVDGIFAWAGVAAAFARRGGPCSHVLS